MIVQSVVGEDLVISVNPRQPETPATEVCRVNGTTGIVTLSKALLTTNSLSLVSTTVGAEASNAIDVVCAIADAHGGLPTAARQVMIETLAVTDDKGDLAAATSAVGTVKKAMNPATGRNVMWMTTTAAGLFSFKVSNDVAEDTLVVIHAEGCQPKVLKLTFA